MQASVEFATSKTKSGITAKVEYQRPKTVQVARRQNPGNTCLMNGGALTRGPKDAVKVRVDENSLCAVCRAWGYA